MQGGSGRLVGLIALAWTALSHFLGLPVLAQEDVLKTDLLAVLAHPDDETMMAMTLARYALVEHRRVSAIYVTRGDRKSTRLNSSHVALSRMPSSA